MCVCPSVCSFLPYLRTRKAIGINFDTGTVSVTGIHHVSSLVGCFFTLTFTQGHTDLDHGNSRFRDCSSNAHHFFCCEHSPTEGQYMIFACPMALTFSKGQGLRSQLRLKRDGFDKREQSSHAYMFSAA